MTNILRDTGTAKGRGVFASRAYSKGEVVEVAPVIVINTVFKLLPEEIRQIVFAWKGRNSAISLGQGSLYNHANPANMSYLCDHSKNVIVYTAARDIALDEELSINYNSDHGEPEWHNNNWFNRMKIKQI